MKKQWRCFHCEEVFTREVDAAEHFGGTMGALTGCQIKGHENNLLAVIRQQEHELSRHRAEDNDIMRAMQSMASEHTLALVREEEKGYDKGVQDMKAQQRELLNAVTEACAIIETGDQRLLACDGPAGGQPPDLTLTEWRRMYVVLDRAKKGSV